MHVYSFRAQSVSLQCDTIAIVFSPIFVKKWKSLCQVFLWGAALESALLPATALLSLERLLVTIAAEAATSHDLTARVPCPMLARPALPQAGPPKWLAGPHKVQLHLHRSEKLQSVLQLAASASWYELNWGAAVLQNILYTQVAPPASAETVWKDDTSVSGPKFSSSKSVIGNYEPEPYCGFSGLCWTSCGLPSWALLLALARPQSSLY